MKKKLTFQGIPPILFIIIAIVIVSATYFNVLTKDFIGALSLMFAIGIIFNEIGERIPLWNTYIGGGIMLAFLGTALINDFKLIPSQYMKLITVATNKWGILNFFIIVLISGSILGLNKKLMIKSFMGYIPTILGSVTGAMILGIIGGLIFGVNPINAMLNYVLPIMGGGNGAGAVPLSQIYEKITGNPAKQYFDFAIVILTIANIFAIISGAVLNRIGEIYPSLTGNKATLMRNDKEIATAVEESMEITLIDIGGGLVLTLAFYAAGLICGNFLWENLMKTFGFNIPIHPFAWMILLIALANVFGLIPDILRIGAKKIQSFFTKNMVIVIMVGVGANTSLKIIVDALTIQNGIIALLIVIGAILGGAIIGYIVGFHPIDSAITAGLCMANRGGSGDLAVLGASDRMELMPYSQLSSRLGGGIVLILGSILFGLFT